MLRQWVLNGRRVHGAIKSVQRVEVTLTSNASGTGSTTSTSTITKVDLTNTVLRMPGLRTGASSAGATQSGRVELQDATTLLFTIGNDAIGNSVTISVEVIEYWPGIVKSVQRGKATDAATGSFNATITAVDLSRATLDYLGTSQNGGAGTGTQRSTYYDLTLTNATTVHGAKGVAQDSSDVGYQVVEWY